MTTYTTSPPYTEAIYTLRIEADKRLPDDQWTIETRYWADGTFTAAAFHTKELTHVENGTVQAARLALHYRNGEIVADTYSIESGDEVLAHIPICDPNGIETGTPERESQ